MMRRLILALLPVAGFALGAALAPFGGSAAALAGGLLGCLALAGLAAPRPPGLHRKLVRRPPQIPRSTPLASHRADLPTVSGYWRAHDEPDWPEGEVRRERASEEEPVSEMR